MKNPLLPLLSLVLLGAACAPSPEKKVELLQQEVMALHDSAMANMGTLYSNRKQLTYLRDSVQVQDTLARQSLTTGITHLVKADEEMMQWMRAYRAPEGKPAPEALQYLQQEKEKIAQVQESITQSLRAADSLNTLYSNTPK
ncbi:hypothetical protein ACD591_18340 [Rufibacter glacialis]|uniref:Viral A-type inclusion protein n=1 Tax=Rufibacter glacialis TaxID=1259555 RepID=A0A5M8Q867_9BACT|nr:hypothetical protein [Rufibacter glacialis]KAA6430802.1 hypothetical protein FOE74_20260 [Rufibacter glacialis]GGK86836.1 hypothetical protein GCM10011405_38270 [Rufibacter glacialis]